MILSPSTRMDTDFLGAAARSIDQGSCMDHQVFSMGRTGHRTAARERAFSIGVTFRKTRRGCALGGHEITSSAEGGSKGLPVSFSKAEM